MNQTDVLSVMWKKMVMSSLHILQRAEFMPVSKCVWTRGGRYGKNSISRFFFFFFSRFHDFITILYDVGLTILCEQYSQTNTWYRNKTNSALFSGTIGVFSRSIQEIEWINIQIKHYIDLFILKQLYIFVSVKRGSFFLIVFCCFNIKNKNSVILYLYHHLFKITFKPEWVSFLCWT